LLVANNLKIGVSGLNLNLPAFNFQITVGNILWICGKNGSGKSFLLQTILGMQKPKEGTVSFSFNSFSYLPQLHELRSHLPFSLKESIPSTFKVEQILSVGLLQEDLLGKAWNTASGGEKQRAFLTRIFLENAELVVLDEPTNHLDRASREKFWSLLIENLNPSRQALVLVSHEEEVEKQMEFLGQRFSWEKIHV